MGKITLRAKVSVVAAIAAIMIIPKEAYPASNSLLNAADTVPAVAVRNADMRGSGRPQSVGLVLSGGGAKGIAHIGTIRALEDAGIPIDYITGTSMGAIVGGLYSCGYTTEEMMEMLLSREFSYWSTGKNDPNLMYYYAEQPPTPSLLTIPVSPRNRKKTAADSVPASLINALPMNFAFMEMFAAYTAQCGGDFDRLFVPFRCVASDVAANHKVVHRSGSVGDAIRSSMSFPIVFQPIKMNGAYLYDGGIYDNFPVDVMTQDFAPDIMIGIDVSSSSSGPRTSMLDQISDLVERPQTYDLPDSLGIKVRINLDNFGLLDFPMARKIYQVGYDKMQSMIDSVKGRVTSRMPAVARETARSVFKSQTPFTRFSGVSVTGGTPRQNEYIRYIFEPADADTFGIVHARESYYRAVSTGKMRDILPHAEWNDSTRLFLLNVNAAPKNDFSFGLGGYVSSSTSSYLFLSAGYTTLSFSSVNASLNGWIGQSYMAGNLNASINLHTGIPSSLGVQGVVSRRRYFETDRLFYEDNRPSFIVGHEYFGRLVYDLAAGARGKVSMAVGYGRLYDSFFRLDAEIEDGTKSRDHTKYDLGQFRIGYTSSTLDDVNYPTEGHYYDFVAMGLLGRYSFGSGDGAVPAVSKHPKWLQLRLRSRNYFDFGTHFALGVEGDALLSTRKLMGSYNADIVNAESFDPTPASTNVFNAQFRANSFLAATLVPVFKYNSSLTARLSLSAFVPMRRILPNGQQGTTAGDKAIPVFCSSRYGDWLSSPRFFGEFDISYKLPIPATVSAYANYASRGARPWGVGISLGIFLHAPRFLQ